MGYNSKSTPTDALYIKVGRFNTVNYRDTSNHDGVSVLGTGNEIAVTFDINSKCSVDAFQFVFVSPVDLGGRLASSNETSPWHEGTMANQILAIPSNGLVQTTDNVSANTNGNSPAPPLEQWDYKFNHPIYAGGGFSWPYDGSSIADSKYTFQYANNALDGLAGSVSNTSPPRLILNRFGAHWHYRIAKRFHNSKYWYRVVVWSDNQRYSIPGTYNQDLPLLTLVFPGTDASRAAIQGGAALGGANSFGAVTSISSSGSTTNAVGANNFYVDDTFTQMAAGHGGLGNLGKARDVSNVSWSYAVTWSNGSDVGTGTGYDSANLTRWNLSANSAVGAHDVFDIEAIALHIVGASNSSIGQTAVNVTTANARTDDDYGPAAPGGGTISGTITAHSTDTVITTANNHGLQTGDVVTFTGVAGGTWGTQLNGNYFVVELDASTPATKFKLYNFTEGFNSNAPVVPTAVDSSGFGSHTGGTGVVCKSLWNSPATPDGGTPSGAVASGRYQNGLSVIDLITQRNYLINGGASGGGIIGVVPPPANLHLDGGASYTTTTISDGSTTFNRGSDSEYYEGIIPSAYNFYPMPKYTVWRYDASAGHVANMGSSSDSTYLNMGSSDEFLWADNCKPSFVPLTSNLTEKYDRLYPSTINNAEGQSTSTIKWVNRGMGEGAMYRDSFTFFDGRSGRYLMNLPKGAPATDTYQGASSTPGNTEQPPNNTFTLNNYSNVQGSEFYTAASSRAAVADKPKIEHGGAIAIAVSGGPEINNSAANNILFEAYSSPSSSIDKDLLLGIQIGLIHDSARTVPKVYATQIVVDVDMASGSGGSKVYTNTVVSNDLPTEFNAATPTPAIILASWNHTDGFHLRINGNLRASSSQNLFAENTCDESNQGGEFLWTGTTANSYPKQTQSVAQHNATADYAWRFNVGGTGGTSVDGALDSALVTDGCYGLWYYIKNNVSQNWVTSHTAAKTILAVDANPGNQANTIELEFTGNHGYETGDFIKFSNFAGTGWTALNDKTRKVTKVNDTKVTIYWFGSASLTDGNYTGSSGSANGARNNFREWVANTTSGGSEVDHLDSVGEESLTYLISPTKNINSRGTFNIGEIIVLTGNSNADDIDNARGWTATAVTQGDMLTSGINIAQLEGYLAHKWSGFIAGSSSTTHAVNANMPSGLVTEHPYRDYNMDTGLAYGGGESWEGYAWIIQVQNGDGTWDGTAWACQISEGAYNARRKVDINPATGAQLSYTNASSVWTLKAKASNQGWTSIRGAADSTAACYALEAGDDLYNQTVFIKDVNGVHKLGRTYNGGNPTNPLANGYYFAFLSPPDGGVGDSSEKGRYFYVDSNGMMANYAAGIIVKQHTLPSAGATFTLTSYDGGNNYTTKTYQFVDNAGYSAGAAVGSNRQVDRGDNLVKTIASVVVSGSGGVGSGLTKLNITSHGYSNGDIIQLSGLAGGAGGTAWSNLNGFVGVVQNSATDELQISFDTANYQANDYTGSSGSIDSPKKRMTNIKNAIEHANNHQNKLAVDLGGDTGEAQIRQVMPGLNGNTTITLSGTTGFLANYPANNEKFQNGASYDSLGWVDDLTNAGTFTNLHCEQEIAITSPSPSPSTGFIGNIATIAGASNQSTIEMAAGTVMPQVGQFVYVKDSKASGGSSDHPTHNNYYKVLAVSSLTMTIGVPDGTTTNIDGSNWTYQANTGMVLAPALYETDNSQEYSPSLLGFAPHNTTRVWNPALGYTANVKLTGLPRVDNSGQTIGLKVIDSLTNVKVQRGWYYIPDSTSVTMAGSNPSCAVGAGSESTGQKMGAFLTINPNGVTIADVDNVTIDGVNHLKVTCSANHNLRAGEVVEIWMYGGSNQWAPMSRTAWVVSLIDGQPTQFTIPTGGITSSWNKANFLAQSGGQYSRFESHGGYHMAGPANNVRTSNVRDNTTSDLARTYCNQTFTLRAKRGTVSGDSVVSTAYAISSVAKGFPTVFTTSANHGFQTGDMVRFSNVTGAGNWWANLLNGNHYIVTVTGPNGFSINADTNGTYYVNNQFLTASNPTASTAITPWMHDTNLAGVYNLDDSIYQFGPCGGVEFKAIANTYGENYIFKYLASDGTYQDLPEGNYHLCSFSHAVPDSNGAKHAIQVTSGGNWTGKIKRCSDGADITIHQVSDNEWYDEDKWVWYKDSSGSVFGNEIAACSALSGATQNLYFQGSLTDGTLKVYSDYAAGTLATAGWYWGCSDTGPIPSGGSGPYREPFECYGEPFIWYSATAAGSLKKLNSTQNIIGEPAAWGLEDLTPTSCDLQDYDIRSKDTGGPRYNNTNGYTSAEFGELELTNGYNSIRQASVPSNVTITAIDFDSSNPAVVTASASHGLSVGAIISFAGMTGGDSQERMNHLVVKVTADSVSGDNTKFKIQNLNGSELLTGAGYVDFTGTSGRVYYPNYTQPALEFSGALKGNNRFGLSRYGSWVRSARRVAAKGSDDGIFFASDMLNGIPAISAPKSGATDMTVAMWIKLGNTQSKNEGTIFDFRDVNVPDVAVLSSGSVLSRMHLRYKELDGSSPKLVLTTSKWAGGVNINFVKDFADSSNSLTLTGSSTSLPLLDKWCLVVVKAGSTGHSITVNGQDGQNYLFASDSNASKFCDATSGITNFSPYIGCDFLGRDTAEMSLGDFIVYDNELDQVNTDELEGFLLHKWGAKIMPNQSTVASVAKGSPTTFTTAEPHGHLTGNVLPFSGFAGTNWTNINGSHTISVTGDYTFTINVNTNVGGYTNGDYTANSGKVGYGHRYQTNGPDCVDTEECGEETCESYIQIKDAGGDGIGDITNAGSTTNNITIPIVYRSSEKVYGYQFKLSGLSSLNITPGTYANGVSAGDWTFTFSDPLAQGFENYAVVSTEESGTSVWIIGFFYDSGRGNLIEEYTAVSGYNPLWQDLLSVTITKNANFSAPAASSIYVNYTSNGTDDEAYASQPVLSTYPSNEEDKQKTPSSHWTGNISTTAGDTSVTVADARNLVSHCIRRSSSQFTGDSSKTPAYQYFERMDTLRKGYHDVNDIVTLLLHIKYNGSAAASSTPLNGTATVRDYSSRSKILALPVCTEQLTKSECEPCPCDIPTLPECISELWIGDIQPQLNVDSITTGHTAPAFHDAGGHQPRIAAHFGRYAVLTLMYRSSCCIDGYWIKFGNLKDFSSNPYIGVGGVLGFVKPNSLNPSAGGETGSRLWWEWNGVDPDINPLIPFSVIGSAGGSKGSTDFLSRTGVAFPVAMGFASGNMLKTIVGSAGGEGSSKIDARLNAQSSWLPDRFGAWCIPPTTDNRGRVLTRIIVNMDSFNGTPTIEEFRLVTNDERKAPNSYDNSTWTGDSSIDADSTVGFDDLVMSIFYSWAGLSPAEAAPVGTVFNAEVDKFDAESDNKALDIVDVLTVSNHISMHGFGDSSNSFEGADSTPSSLIVPQDCCPCEKPGTFTLTPTIYPCFCWEEGYDASKKGTVDLSWTASSNAKGYTILRRGWRPETNTNQVMKLDAMKSRLRSQTQTLINYNKEWQKIAVVKPGTTSWTDRNPPTPRRCCPDDIMPTVEYVVIAFNECGETVQKTRVRPKCCNRAPKANPLVLETTANQPVHFMTPVFDPDAPAPFGGPTKKATATITINSVPANKDVIKIEDWNDRWSDFKFNTSNGGDASHYNGITLHPDGDGSINVGIAGLSSTTDIAARLATAINGRTAAIPDRYDITAVASTNKITLTQGRATECGNTIIYVTQSGSAISKTNFVRGNKPCNPAVEECDKLRIAITGVSVPGGYFAGSGGLPYNNTGQFSYIPPANYTGSIVISYVVMDRSGCKDRSTITIRIKPPRIKIRCWTAPCNTREHGVVKIQWGRVKEMRVLKYEVQRKVTGADDGTYTVVGTQAGNVDSNTLEMNWKDRPTPPDKCCTGSDGDISYTYRVAVYGLNAPTSWSASRGGEGLTHYSAALSSYQKPVAYSWECTVIIPCCPLPRNPMPRVDVSDCDGTPASIRIYAKHVSSYNENGSWIKIIDNSGAANELTLTTASNINVNNSTSASVTAATIGTQDMNSPGKAARALYIAIKHAIDNHGFNATVAGDADDAEDHGYVTITQATVGAAGNKSVSHGAGAEKIQFLESPTKFQGGYDAADHAKVLLRWRPVLASVGSVSTVSAGATTSMKIINHGLSVGDKISFTGFTGGWAYLNTPVSQGHESVPKEWLVSAVDFNNITITDTTGGNVNSSAWGSYTAHQANALSASTVQRYWVWKKRHASSTFRRLKALRANESVITRFNGAEYFLEDNIKACDECNGRFTLNYAITAGSKRGVSGNPNDSSWATWLSTQPEIQSFAKGATTTTINTASAHNFNTGDFVTFSEIEGAGWTNLNNTTHKITKVDSDTFTIVYNSNSYTNGDFSEGEVIKYFQGDPCSPGGTTKQAGIVCCPPTPCVEPSSHKACIEDVISGKIIAGCIAENADPAPAFAFTDSGNGHYNGISSKISLTASSGAYTINTHGIPAGTYTWVVTVSACGKSGTSTFTLILEDCGCPCPDDEKDYTICDMNYIQSDFSKASGVNQVPFSLSRKGGQTLRRVDTVYVATQGVDGKSED